jgi:hypothetical protein
MVEGSQITDLAPTILYLLGMPVPDAMDGRVLLDALQPMTLNERPVQYVHTDNDGQGKEMTLSDKDAAEIEDRLRALGYLG